MKKILQELSKRSILLHDVDFSSRQIKAKWLGFEPATEAQIDAAQATLGQQLPEDYLEFVRVTNGFTQPSGSNPSFLPIDRVDFLINLDEEMVAAWSAMDEGNEIGQALSGSILVAGLGEEQQFLLLPPDAQHPNWRYWLFANWLPGEAAFEGLEEYFRSTLDELKELTKSLKPKIKSSIDYTLLLSCYRFEWENAYDIALSWLREQRAYPYFDGPADLLRVLELSSAKLGQNSRLMNDLPSLKTLFEEQAWIIQRIEAIETALIHFPGQHFSHNELAFQIRPSGMSLEQIEAQTAHFRPELMKPKNLLEKIDYQLYFLFADGNAEAFINLYEQHSDSPFFQTHIKAAVVYAHLNKPSQSRGAIERYLAVSFAYRPLEPFLIEALQTVMTADFASEMLERFGSEI